MAGEDAAAAAAGSATSTAPVNLSIPADASPEDLKKLLASAKHELTASLQKKKSLDKGLVRSTMAHAVTRLISHVLGSDRKDLV